jgi:hypothetical protein
VPDRWNAPHESATVSHGKAVATLASCPSRPSPNP